MLRILVVTVALIFSVLIVSCGGNSNQTQQNTINNTTDTVLGKPIIDFDTAVFNFGRILQGEQVSYNFKFKNIGSANLLIKKVETSCGCTVPEYDKNPVGANQTGYIKVRFDSSNKSGTQYKTVKVYTNCEENIYDLVITGEVEER